MAHPRSPSRRSASAPSPRAPRSLGLAAASPASTVHQRLLGLRQRLISSVDLSEPADYFLDHLMLDRAFLDDGSPEENPTLRAVLEAAASACLGTPVEMPSFDPIHLPSARFWHGALLFDRHAGAFFYFDDADVGLAGIGSLTSPMSTFYLRFTLTPVTGAGPAFPSRGSPDRN